MSISRGFETSAIRQGFVIEVEQNYYSEVFSLYGFHFELIAEKVPKDESSNCAFQFYIQVNLFIAVLFKLRGFKLSNLEQKRLATNDPILTYEQSQLEIFSLRNDRCVSYSISVQYWFNGNQVFNTTGLKRQRFGKAKSQTTPSFYVEIPTLDVNDEEMPLNELFVQYSFIFPSD